MTTILRYLLWLHLLTVVFIILQISQVIDWNWGYILLPSIIDVVINYFIIVIIDIYLGWVYSNSKGKKGRPYSYRKKHSDQQ